MKSKYVRDGGIFLRPMSDPVRASSCTYLKCREPAVAIYRVSSIDSEHEGSWYRWPAISGPIAEIRVCALHRSVPEALCEKSWTVD